MTKKFSIFFTIFFLMNHLFAQKDSIPPSKIEIFKIDYSSQELEETSVDTSITGFENYYLFYEKDYSRVFLGNLGLPYHTTIFQPNLYNDFIFTQNIQDYWINSSDVQYLNTNKPYTHFYLFTGPRLDKENVVRVMHSRNINPYWNVTLNGAFNGAEGAYNFQQTRGSSVYASTNYQKKNLKFFAYTMFNKQTNYENGGINDSIEIIGNQIPVKMDDASNIYAEKQFSQHFIYTVPINIRKKELVHKNNKDTLEEHILKKTLFVISESLYYNPNYKIYRDNAVPDLMYGGAWSYSENQSFDSIYHSDYEARFRIASGDEVLPIVKFGFFAEYMHKKSSLYNFKEYVINENIRLNSENSYTFGLYNESSKFLNWRLSYDKKISGYRIDDYALKGNLSINLFANKFPVQLSLKGNYSYQTPSLWIYSYYGNRLSWELSPDKMALTNINAAFRLEKLNLKIAIESGSIDNAIYFNEEAKASQFNQTLNYRNAQLFNILKIWNFRLSTKLTYQELSDTVKFKFPKITYRGSFYYEGKTISKAMYNQIGFEAYYFSSYFSPYYNPSSSMFYNQTNEQVGGFPLINFFINAQLRRSRVFLKFMNLNYVITNELFYTVPDYPLPDAYFRFGISWRFYD